MLVEMITTLADPDKILLSGKVYDLDEKFADELLKLNACKLQDPDALPAKGSKARRNKMPESTPDPLGKE